MDFNDILARLKAHPGDPCITITTNAARTYMDAGSTREHLKRLERQAEAVMRQHYDKRTVQPVIERSRELIANIKKVNHLPGIALFANKEVGEVVHLPFDVQDRVTVGSSFFTRELLRTGLESIAYHVLMLGAGQARLFAVNDTHLLGEVRGRFPLRNTHYTTDPVEQSKAGTLDAQQRRFHVEVGHAVHDVVGAGAIVVVAATTDVFSHFMKNVEHTDVYQAHLKGNFDHTPVPEMVLAAWELVHEAQKRRHLDELHRAADGPRTLFTTAADEIWSHVSNGRGKVLFVERGSHQAARFENDHVVLMAEGSDHLPGVDLVDAIIEEQVEHRGEVRILPDGSMAEHGGMALKMRY